LMKKLAREVRQPFTGSISRRRSMHKVARNFDVKRTVRSNLKHFDRERRKIIIQTPYFFSRQKRQLERWQVIILVDQSGSMVDSVIHSAVTASIFHQLPGIKCHLIAFDTSVVDLTSDVSDPVETLMKVQLGGGTEIGRALQYGLDLIENPRRTIVVLITDFYEGAPIHIMYDTARRILEGGSYLLGLAALSADAVPNYDREVAQRLANMGAHIAAMTPGELAHWVAEKIR